MEQKIIFPHEVNAGDVVTPYTGFFSVENIADNDITIDVRASCGCIAIPMPKITIPALKSIDVAFVITIKRVDSKEIFLNENGKFLGSVRVNWK